MTEARVLTSQGVTKFAEYLAGLRQNNIAPFSLDILNHSPWSSPFEPVVEVEQKVFANRMEMGNYLVQIFEKAAVKPDQIFNHKGLWSWFAACWFDIICPPAADGTRTVRESAKYLCSLDWRDYYRHLVGSSWMAYSRHAQYSRLLLHSAPPVHNDFMEQLASKQSIALSQKLIEVADRLYWEPGASRPKKNGSNPNIPGNVRRFVALVWQLELTWDVYSMPAAKILEVLPPEFDLWK